MTDELETIRTRHEADDKTRQYIGFLDAPAALRAARQAHADRATLLRALDEAQERAEPWTDDDQRGLNAAVADAMWYWDDMPMDPDDAISLTGILKDRLQENGFQIVRCAAVNALPELLARVRRLEEALKPFAEIAQYDIGNSEANDDLFRPMMFNNRGPLLTVGMFRRARAALKETGQ